MLWLSHFSANDNCQIRCANPTRRQCIPKRYMCDGDRYEMNQLNGWHWRCFFVSIKRLHRRYRWRFEILWWWERTFDLVMFSLSSTFSAHFPSFRLSRSNTMRESWIWTGLRAQDMDVWWGSVSLRHWIRFQNKKKSTCLVTSDCQDGSDENPQYCGKIFPSFCRCIYFFDFWRFNRSINDNYRNEWVFVFVFYSFEQISKRSNFDIFPISYNVDCQIGSIKSGIRSKC